MRTRIYLSVHEQEKKLVEDDDRIEANDHLEIPDSSEGMRLDIS